MQVTVRAGCQKSLCTPYASWIRRMLRQSLLIVFAFSSIPCMAQVLTYSGTNLTARWQNDGGFNSESAMTITLSGSTNNFATNGQDFVAMGFVTPTNVPYGLTASCLRTATNTVKVYLNGFAATNGVNVNGSAYNTTNLAFIFNNGAFSNGNASTIAGSTGTNLISVCFLPAAPLNWYVDANSGYDTQGTGAGQGNGSAAHPWGSITNALKHAQYSANDVIHIASGIYTQPQINMTNIVTLVGANPLTTIVEPATQPNVVTNASVFSYANYLPGIYANLTIQNGRAANGGGIYMSSSATAGVTPDLIITNCIFLNNCATNTSGGAVYNSASAIGASMVLAGCIFSNNVATNGGGKGGAVYSGNSSPVFYLTNCVFVSNAANTNGGAVLGHVATITGSWLANNVSTFGAGGGVYAPSSYGPLMINGSTFANNAAGMIGASGQSQQMGGGGLCFGGQYSLTIFNSTFYGNTASNGQGGAYCFFSNTGGVSNYVYNSTFAMNSATNGGAIYAYGAPAFYSTIVASNAVTTGVCKDIYVTGASFATNSIIGVTNGLTTTSLPNVATTNVMNKYGDYLGSTATPQNPGLLPLAQNGGLVPTCALQPGSVAVHTGSNLSGLLYDERGAPYPRTINGQTDMGAFEISPPFGTTFSF